MPDTNKTSVSDVAADVATGLAANYGGWAVGDGIRPVVGDSIADAVADGVGIIGDILSAL